MSLKLIRRQKSPSYYLRGTVRGQAVFETTGTDDRKAAEAIRIKREAELLDRSIFGTAATVTFLEAAVSYIEAGGEARYVGHYDAQSQTWSGLVGQFAQTIISEIGQVEADAAARNLFPQTAAATRKRHVYGPLIAVLNHASEKWAVSVKRIKAPKVAKTPVQWATPEYVQKLLPHCAPKLRRFVVVLVYTGERLEKIHGIDWDRDVDLRLRLITFPTTKNGEMRTVHIAEPLLVELSAVPEDARHGRMFDWSDKCAVNRLLKTASKRAGLPYLSTHKLGRHTHATWLRRFAGRDLRGLMEDLGWKSINSAVRYAHVVAGETTAAVDKLPSVQISSSSNVKPLKDRRIRKKIAS